MNARAWAHVHITMLQLALLSVLIVTPPAAEDVRELENDMAEGHRAVLESGQMPVTAEPSVVKPLSQPGGGGESETAVDDVLEPVDSDVGRMEQCPSPTVAATADVRDDARPMRREGLTYEVGLGLGGTNDYVDGGNRVVGMASAGIGGFLNNRTALLLHFAGVSNSHYERFRFDDQRVDLEGNIFTLFLGPQLQWFATDRLMLAAGVGGVARLVGTQVDVRGTSIGDYDDAFAEAGVGASIRAAIAVYQRKDIAAVRIGVEALPTYVQSEWRNSVALMAEVQVF